MDRRQLEINLAGAFDAPDGKCRAVARAAGDLADSGRYQEDVGADLTVDHVIEELQDAPDDHDLVERWNWWIGSLELAYGGYDQFRVLRWAPE